MIEVALLLNDHAYGAEPASLRVVRVRMSTVPRNSEEISLSGRIYVVTHVRYLFGDLVILADSPEQAARIAESARVEVEVTAWSRR